MAKKLYYLNNKDIMVEFKLSKSAGRMTDTFAKMMLKLVDKIGSKPNFSGYSYLEEMKGDALVNLVSKWNKFDDEKYDNPFAYFSQFVFNSFLQYLKKERRQQNIRDAVMVSNGLVASFRYMHQDSPDVDDEADFHSLVKEHKKVQGQLL